MLRLAGRFQDAKERTCSHAPYPLSDLHHGTRASPRAMRNFESHLKLNLSFLTWRADLRGVGVEQKEAKRPLCLHVSRSFVKHLKLFPIAGLPASGWTTARWEATRTTWGARPPWGSSTPSRLLTILICTTTPTRLWSWCLSSSKTCAGSKRSFIMRRGYGLPLFYVFHLSLVFLFLSLALSQRQFSRSLSSPTMKGSPCDTCYGTASAEPVNSLLSLHIQGQKRFLETTSSDLVGWCQ